MKENKRASAQEAEGERAAEPGPEMSARQTKSGSQTVPQAFTLSGRRPAGAGAVVLSQAPRDMSHRARLAWLQKRRCMGLWAACDACDKYRFLERVHEPLQLPDKWYCRMNPDKRYAHCSVPEVGLSVAEEEDLVHAPYGAGSLVWAHMPGFPRWPALVDDEPDTEQYYWLDGFSDIPTHYNVVFFDSPARPAERAWIAPRFLQKYNLTTANPPKGKYCKRLLDAQTQANEALTLPVYERLKKFSFLARYSGHIDRPKQFSRRELKRFGEFTDDSSEDSDDSWEREAGAAPARSPVSVPIKTVSLTLKQRVEKSLSDEPIAPTTPDTHISAVSPAAAHDTHTTIEDTPMEMERTKTVDVESKTEEDKPMAVKRDEDRTPAASSSVYELSTRAHKDPDSDDFEF